MSEPLFAGLDFRGFAVGRWVLETVAIVLRLALTGTTSSARSEALAATIVL